MKSHRDLNQEKEIDWIKDGMQFPDSRLGGGEMNKKMDKEIEMIFRDYLNERGNVPDYAKFLAEENPEFF